MVWALMQASVSANLDGYADMLESYAWGQTWVWGTFKHPPFFAWVAGLWFKVFPTAPWAFFVLAYTNVWFALVAVVLLARRLGMGVLAFACAQLLTLALPYTNLASKFNANSMLVSIWPWMALCMVASWQEKGAKAWLWALALGAFTAAGMLSKYYTALMMCTLLVAALLHPDGRRWLMRPLPWMALGVCALLMWPHVQWLVAHDYPSITYVEKHGDGQVHWKFFLTFMAAPVLYWLPAWLTAVVAALRATPSSEPVLKRWLGAAVAIWKPQGWQDSIFWLALLPWFITLLFGISGAVLLSIHWVNPIGYAFGILWLRNLTQHMPYAQQQKVAQTIHRVWKWALAVVVVLGAAWGWVCVHDSKNPYNRPDAEGAQAVVQAWQAQHPAQTLRWVGGAWAFNGAIAFYVDNQVRVITGLPDVPPATIDPLPHWQQQAGLLFCPLGRVDDANQAQQLPATACDQQAQQWLQQKGLPAQATTVVAKRSGWRFPNAPLYGYRFYSYSPVQ